MDVHECVPKDLLSSRKDQFFSKKSCAHIVAGIDIGFLPVLSDSKFPNLTHSEQSHLMLCKTVFWG